MYRRLIILSSVIVLSLAGLSLLGYRAIELQAEGLQGKRIKDFADVAEQIRRDVKRKLDAFIEVETKRPYTDYQYYFVPENVALNQQQMPLLVSPLAEKLDWGLSFGHFQIESDGSIITPFAAPAELAEANSELAMHLKNVADNILPMLNGQRGDGWEISHVASAAGENETSPGKPEGAFLCPEHGFHVVQANRFCGVYSPGAAVVAVQSQELALLPGYKPQGTVLCVD